MLAPGTPHPASSVRNHLAGTVGRLVSVGPYVRAVIDCGFYLVALVTHRSVEELGLREGTPVIAAFKATAPHVIPRGDLR